MTKKQPPLAERLLAKLRKLGLSERKATVFAKGLAPLVRSIVKAEVKQYPKPQELEPHYLPANRPFTKKKAIKVNGESLRFDLPVAPMVGIKGIELLRVMDGLTSEATYLVAAVREEQGIVAIRQFTDDYYNVKFYPDMAFWGKTREDLYAIGAHSHHRREWYERVHVNQETLGAILQQLEQDAKPKSRMKALVDRFKTVTSAVLLKAFSYLHAKEEVA